MCAGKCLTPDSIKKGGAGGGRGRGGRGGEISSLTPPQDASKTSSNATGWAFLADRLPTRHHHISTQRLALSLFDPRPAGMCSHRASAQNKAAWRKSSKWKELSKAWEQAAAAGTRKPSCRIRLQITVFSFFLRATFLRRTPLLGILPGML